jgi:hypothetical protein
MRGGGGGVSVAPLVMQASVCHGGLTGRDLENGDSPTRRGDDEATEAD